MDSRRLVTARSVCTLTSILLLSGCGSSSSGGNGDDGTGGTDADPCKASAAVFDPDAILEYHVTMDPALYEDLRSLVPPDGRLVGNLPYYVSSPLLRRILDLHDHVRDAHVMLQEEVARRIASPPGSREYGILSILYALWADVDLPLKLPPGAFRPPPRVSSALLRARFREEARAEVADLQAFEVFLKQAFARRRRTLENNLQDSYPNLKEYLRLLNLEGSRRAETLSVVEFVALWRALKAG